MRRAHRAGRYRRRRRGGDADRVPGYLAKRTFDISPSKVYAQAEQVTIASDLAAPLADLGVAVIAAAGAGFQARPHV